MTNATPLFIIDTVKPSWNRKDYPKANSKSIDKNYTHTGIYGAKLDRRTATIKNGKTVSFKVTGTKKTVTFTSDDKSIATVNSKGLVKGIKAGNFSYIERNLR